MLSPSLPPAVTGNAVTAARWQCHLEALGIEVVLIDASRDDASDRLAALMPAIDLVHVHHARKSGQVALNTPAARTVPWVVSFAGTDVWSNDVDPVMEATGNLARLLLSPDPNILHALPPAWHDKFRLIPKGIDLPATAPLPELNLAPGDFLFFLPAGIRMVKRPLMALDALEPLAARYPVHLLLAGPILDDALGQRLKERLQTRPWASYHPPFSRAEMVALYDRADVVLNCSLAEGFSNAVAEAMSRHRPVLAARNAGNLAALAETGLLFDDLSGFTEGAERLFTDAQLRRSLGEAAGRRAERAFAPSAERDALTACYAEALQSKTPPQERR